MIHGFVCPGGGTSGGIRFADEAFDGHQKPRHAIVVSRSRLFVHQVKIADTHIRQGEVSVPVLGGNDQFHQLLKESGVWWPMQVVIGMCALLQQVRTNPAFMFVPTAKTRRRVEVMPSSVQTVLTIAFKRNGYACLEIPASGSGVVVVHDVTMRSSSEMARQAKIDEWKSIVDKFTRASALWKSKLPVPHKCIMCEDAVDFGKLDSPVHSVQMVRTFLVGKAWGAGLPWPSPSTFRKRLVNEFESIWRSLQARRCFVACGNDRGLDGGLHTLAFRVREGPATFNERVRDNGGKGDS